MATLLREHHILLIGLVFAVWIAYLSRYVIFLREHIVANACKESVLYLCFRSTYTKVTGKNSPAYRYLDSPSQHRIQWLVWTGWVRIDNSRTEERNLLFGTSRTSMKHQEDRFLNLVKKKSACSKGSCHASERCVRYPISGRGLTYRIWRANLLCNVLLVLWKQLWVKLDVSGFLGKTMSCGLRVEWGNIRRHHEHCRSPLRLRSKGRS